MIPLVWRGLLERKVRTSLTLVGVAVCVLALTTADGMLGHMRAERVHDVARFAGRVLLQPQGAGYPPFKSVLRETSVESALAGPDVVAAESTPLLFVALEPADNPMDIARVLGLGLWPGRERAWLGDIQSASGRATLAGEGEDAVLLGSKAARYYDVSTVGDTLHLAGRRWRVTGILKKASVPDLDVVDTLVVMPLATAQAAFGLDGWISAVLITAADGRHGELAQSLAATYPALEINTQEDIQHVLSLEMRLPNKFLGTISWTAFVIAGLIIANVMSIGVRERTQQVDRIRAIGAGRSAILRYALAEALILSLIGGLLGVLAAVPTAYAFGWPWILTWGEMARVVALVLAAAMLAGAYPAFRAARAYPQALRYEELRRQMEAMAAEKRAMDQAYRHLVRGREEERASLARELHDQTMQSLVGLKFRLAEAAPDAEAELQPEIDGMIDALRELCAGLRPQALDRLGLVAALRAFMDDFGARNGLPIALRVDGEERRLSPEVELSLFRVAQEALANAWKHAQAPKVEVGLSFGEDRVRLAVCDRGRGFAVPRRLGALAEAGHFGLLGMRERLELVRGGLDLSAEPGRGTTVTVWVPYSAAE